jgi:hypothetical protein
VSSYENNSYLQLNQNHCEGGCEIVVGLSVGAVGAGFALVGALRVGKYSGPV